MDMSTKETTRSLWKQIENNRIKSISGRYFVPRSSLTAIFTPLAISKAVAELDCEFEDRIGLSKDIHQDGIITFAILVWMHQEEAIVKFRRHRCLDSHGPLDPSTVLSIAPDFGNTFSREVQLEFRPHFFHRGEDVEFNQLDILPFIGPGKELKGGGYGAVTELAVHSSLQDFYPDKGVKITVIRKTLRLDAFKSEDSRRAAFNQEKRCLRLFNNPQHPNIVPLLSAYVHGSDYCLVFPRLEMDLACFFSKPTRHGHFQWDYTFFSALHGLSSALSRTHNIYIPTETDVLGTSLVGYHHDFRPANILVNEETFLLADFGMGRVKAEGEDSRTTWKASVGSYLAPECMDERFIEQDVGRAVDVWAFGCLAAEVATFMTYGPDGLSEFRKKRKSARDQMPNCTDIYFHSRGEVKESVREWLDFLKSDGRLAAVNLHLHRLIFSILVPADVRPNITSICKQLGQISLKAHFLAALDLFHSLVDEARGPTQTPLMKLWFERERLKAFGRVSCLNGTKTDDPVLEIVCNHGEASIKTLLKLFHQLREMGAGPSSPGQTVNNSHYQAQAFQATQPQDAHPTINGSKMLWETFRVRLQSLVNDLWAMLPETELRTAEMLWVRSMLMDQDSTQWLNELGNALNTENRPIYQRGAAMAFMRKIRLEFTKNEAGDKDLQNLRTIHTKVVKFGKFSGHELAILENVSGSEGVPVLVETMHYDPSWEKVPPTERTFIMADKAKGFGIQPKPRDLRLLNCLKFFEVEDKNQTGYAFVYQVPPIQPGMPAISAREYTVTTLLELLITSAKLARDDPSMGQVFQPLLGHKFRLASMLASNLYAFHSIGWYHENYHSNNVVFFNASHYLTDGDGNYGKRLITSPQQSKILLEPYLVGLNKSRPGGEAWHTQGPSLDTELGDYQHPSYRQVTKHYRNGYDYYSLGVMLLEIGLWMPLQAWANGGERGINRTLSPDQLRSLLLSRYVPRLAPRMGQSYYNVVQLLLSDALDPSSTMETPDPAIEADAFGKFFDSVVIPLSRLANTLV